MLGIDFVLRCQDSVRWYLNVNMIDNNAFSQRG